VTIGVWLRGVVLAWWFLFYWSGYQWVHYGPFIEQATCEQTVKNLQQAGFTARCVRVEF